MAYATTVNGIDFSFDFGTEVVSVDALTEKLDADSLQEAAREAESSEEGIASPPIVATSGKVTLDSESETGLNVVLQETWLILSLKVSGLFTVSGGNVVSDLTGVEIFAPNPTVDTQNNTSQAGVRVFAGGGCDLTEVLEKLTAITDNQEIINEGVQLSSLIIPHTTDLPSEDAFTVDSDLITVDSDTITADKTEI